MTDIIYGQGWTATTRGKVIDGVKVDTYKQYTIIKLRELAERYHYNFCLVNIISRYEKCRSVRQSVIADIQFMDNKMYFLHYHVFEEKYGEISKFLEKVARVKSLIEYLKKNRMSMAHFMHISRCYFEGFDCVALGRVERTIQFTMNCMGCDENIEYTVGTHGYTKGLAEYHQCRDIRYHNVVYKCDGIKYNPLQSDVRLEVCKERVGVRIRNHLDLVPECGVIKTKSKD